ncbi:unnamed protein product [Dovyalis caffra]|uniref:AB hydrolase-1 domain-containing protein n=1 Tax=Dovyalis caffra TaxID=77055 RepID=A0AAV1RUI0_9ROSI|nr:unnamed protein product [Dovyalis caffra]
MENAKHFVLVHGLGHGAWSWYKIVALLKSAGHRVTALDLGASGVNPSKFDEICSFSNYVLPLMDFMATLPEDEKVILVGHSFGGYGISLAMEIFPKKILVAVYVTAFMPNHVSPPAILLQEFFNRTSVESQLDFQLSFDNGPENLPISGFGISKNAGKTRSVFLMDLANESLLTEEKFGSVKRVFIVCEADELLKKDFQEWFIERSPTKDVKFIAGADHMAMISKPKELCLCFQKIADKYYRTCHQEGLVLT